MREMIEQILNKNNFWYNSESNEYKKGNWTVRFDEDLIEVFNNPEKSKGVYYCGPINKVDLETILDEIENFEFNLEH